MRSNSRDFSYFNQANIHAVLLPHSAIPSFAIPLAKPNEQSNSDYTPTTDAHGKINGFAPVETAGNVIPLRYEQNVEIGQNEIYAIVDPDGNALVGTKDDLIPKIEKWITAIGDNVSQLNFALFCDNERHIHTLGQRVYSNKLSETGSKEATVRWFTYAFVCLPILREIISQSLQEKHTTLDRFASLAPSVNINDSSNLSIIFPGEIFTNSDISQKLLEKIISRMLFFTQASTGLKTIIQFSSSGSRDTSPQFGEIESNIQSEISRIQRFSKQERRVAEALLLYILDIDTASDFLIHYMDSSGYANRALSVLRKAAQSHNKTEVSRAEQVSKLVPQFIRIAFPHQRGRVILEIARVLGYYPTIAKAIRDSITRSRQKEIIAVEASASKFLKL